MATTRDAIKKRLEQLARRKNRCPQHMTPLWCVLESEWLGTPDEWEELAALIPRIEPDFASLPLSGVLCATCKEPRYCIECGQEYFASLPPRKHDLSPDEAARYRVLIHLFRPTPQGQHRSPDFFRNTLANALNPPSLAAKEDDNQQEIISNSESGITNNSPEPIAPPISPPAVSIPSPAPVVDDDDEEADPALVDLVNELTQKLRFR